MVRDRIQAVALFNPKNMRKLTRVHHSGTRAVTRQHPDGWRITIKLRETGHGPATIVAYLLPNVDEAKKRADQELAKYGHVCNEVCKGWEESSE